MNYLDQYRDQGAVRSLAESIRRQVTRPWTLMEVCGGQTHAIMRFGLQSLLPEEITLIHGPGCPVCVTPVEMIDAAIAVSRLRNVILCSYGDMLRVPGSATNLQAAKAEGADVRMIYSPLDALRLARENPGKEVVFFAVGFETTAPANALAIWQARQQDIANFSAIVSHVLVPPAMEALLASPDNRVQGFLAAGHVCTVMGTGAYLPLAEKYRVPIVVTGFEPVDILQGIASALRQLETGQASVENQYERSVQSEGNRHARAVMDKVFRVVDRTWRGMGEIPASGLGLAPEFAALDALQRFEVGAVGPEPDSGCISGLVLRGLRRPDQCPHFGGLCTPDHPLGATMVSGEGACAAYFRYQPAPASVN